jgi:hypothetical protein
VRRSRDAADRQRRHVVLDAMTATTIGVFVVQAAPPPCMNAVGIDELE